jgi:hypothetical protein
MELGKTLGNISEACRKLGVSRQHYYDIKEAIEEEGLEGLLAKSRRAPRVGNRVVPEIEQKVLDYSLEFPTQGQARTANELKKKGIAVSAGGVRSIWMILCNNDSAIGHLLAFLYRTKRDFVHVGFHE